jgi:hypothetical protein
MKARVLAVAAIAMLGLPLSAAAWLGGDATSIQADQARLKGSVRTTAAANYTRFDIETPSGTVVREYLSPGGRVFAVTWEGPTLPDLRQVLGNYFDQYVEAANAAGGGGGPRAIRKPGLVVFAGGHLRAFTGTAAVPELIPQGVGLEELQ